MIKSPHVKCINDTQVLDSNVVRANAVWDGIVHS